MTIYAYQALLNLVLINAGLALSQYIVLRAGVFSIATVGFASLGAYSTALMVMRLDLPASVALLCATIAGAGIGALLSVPLLRLRGIYAAIATLSFVQIVATLAYYFEDLTGGALGLNNIPKLVGTTELLVVFALAFYLVFAVGRSGAGRALDAIRQDEVVAKSLGVSIVRHHVLAFAISGGIATSFGGLIALHSYAINPHEFGFHLMVTVLAFVVLGGRVSILGPVVGAALLTTLPEISRPLGEYRELINGALLIVVMVFLPSGLVDSTVHYLRRRSAERASSKDERADVVTTA
ncbi:MAG: branched-chain amino acid ABC transporter permease [Rhizobiaceae bacterium]